MPPTHDNCNSSPEVYVQFLSLPSFCGTVNCSEEMKADFNPRDHFNVVITYSAVFGEDVSDLVAH